MEIKPVKNVETPKYPIREKITADTLKSSVPKRWSSSAAAKVALGTLAAMSLAGCVPPQIQTAGVPLPPSATTEESFVSQSTPTVVYSQTAGVPEPSQTPVVEYTPVGTFAPATISVAPLFIHGDGRGAFGCVMVAPPVFLSEDDALAVVNEAAKEYGLTFSSKDCPEFSNVLQPETDLNPEAIGGNTSRPEKTDKIITLKADFTDNKHNIAIEFVSVDDVKEWSQSPSGATVEEYDTKDAAAQLSESLENSFNGGNYITAVLYDPCESSGDRKTDVRALSEADLRAQAEDFFKWLRQQGII